MAPTLTVPRNADELEEMLGDIENVRKISATPDTFKAQVLNSSGTVLATIGSFSNLNKNTGYAQKTVDLSAYAGQTVTLKFTGTETDANGGTTNFIIDDTAVTTS